MFFARLCEVIGRLELAARQYEADQEALRAELAAIFATRARADWLSLVRGRGRLRRPGGDTLAEAHADLGPWPERPPDVPLGAHTDAWRDAVAAAGS